MLALNRCSVLNDDKFFKKEKEPGEGIVRVVTHAEVGVLLEQA
jgi:hypothetical protein